MFILLLLAGGAYAQQKTVRILAIGNSFSQDAVEQYLHELAEAKAFQPSSAICLSAAVRWNVM